MKTPKTTAARGALALVAASSVLALSACSAGQISQTANQVAAVPGSGANEGNIAIRDAAVVVTPDNNLTVKFTAANVEDDGDVATLQNLTVNGNRVAISGDDTVGPGCNLVGYDRAHLDEIKEGAGNTCNTYVETRLSNSSDIYIAGEAELEFNFDKSTVTMQAPVTAYTPVAGQYHRQDGQLADKETQGSSSEH